MEDAEGLVLSLPLEGMPTSLVVGPKPDDALSSTKWVMASLSCASHFGMVGAVQGHQHAGCTGRKGRNKVS